MAPLPRPFSVKACEIEAAISEGRSEEALQKLVHALRAQEDNRAVRWLAAEWIERISLPGGAAKALRKGRAALREDWLSIAEMVGQKQSDGTSYAAAVSETAAYFGCSERHVQGCVADWHAAELASREE
jgi:hypothetical protein